MKPLLIIAAALACVGCNTISYQRDGVTVKCSRVFWSTESYSVSFSTNSASLDVNKSGPSVEALTAIKAIADSVK